jgi:DNA polymerase-3 subunit delta
LDHAGFVKAVERGQPPPVALLHGPDMQALDDALALATRVLFPDAAAAAFDREIFDGAEVEVESVVNAAMTLPVVARTRLVAVRRAHRLAARGSEALARYAGRPNPAACLLLLAEETLGPGPDRKTAHWLLGAVPGPAVVPLFLRRGHDPAAWLRQRARAEGLAVSEAAARLLVQFVGDDSAALLGEVRKAALAGGPDNRAVDEAAVAAVVGQHRVSRVFELTAAIGRGDAGTALRTLDRLLETEEAPGILFMLTREVRNRWTATAWRERGQPVEQIARILRCPPGLVEAWTASAEPPAAFARRLERCWRTEQRLKSGGQERAELAALVVELCGAGGRGR